MGSRRLSALVSLALILAACGGAETVDEPDPTTSPTVATAVTAPPSTATQNAVPAPELAGTKWNVTDYILASGSFTNVWKTDITIAFAADGTVSGTTGCNDYQGTWETEGPYDEFESGVPDVNDGQVIRLNDLTWTEIACEDEAIMEQEAEHIDLLQQAGRWVIIRGDFNLRNSDGEFLFNAVPLP